MLQDLIGQTIKLFKGEVGRAALAADNPASAAIAPTDSFETVLASAGATGLRTGLTIVDVATTGAPDLDNAQATPVISSGEAQEAERRDMHPALEDAGAVPLPATSSGTAVHFASDADEEVGLDLTDTAPSDSSDMLFSLPLAQRQQPDMERMEDQASPNLEPHDASPIWPGRETSRLGGILPRALDTASIISAVVAVPADKSSMPPFDGSDTDSEKAKFKVGSSQTALLADEATILAPAGVQVPARALGLAASVLSDGTGVAVQEGEIRAAAQNTPEKMQPPRTFPVAERADSTADMAAFTRNAPVTGPSTASAPERSTLSNTLGLAGSIRDAATDQVVARPVQAPGAISGLVGPDFMPNIVHPQKAAGAATPAVPAAAHDAKAAASGSQVAQTMGDRITPPMSAAIQPEPWLSSQRYPAEQMGITDHGPDAASQPVSSVSRVGVQSRNIAEPMQRSPVEPVPGTPPHALRASVPAAQIMQANGLETTARARPVQSAGSERRHVPDTVKWPMTPTEVRPAEGRGPDGSVAVRPPTKAAIVPQPASTSQSLAASGGGLQPLISGNPGSGMSAVLRGSAPMTGADPTVSRRSDAQILAAGPVYHADPLDAAAARAETPSGAGVFPLRGARSSDMGRAQASLQPPSTQLVHEGDDGGQSLVPPSRFESKLAPAPGAPANLPPRTVNGTGAKQTPPGPPAPLPGPQGAAAAFQPLPDLIGAPPAQIELSAQFDGSGPLRAASDPSVMRGDLPRHLSFQIVEAIQQRGMGQRVELQLNPVELGKVSMQLQMVDNTAVVHILADRPETLDLMRRHIELLAQDFRAIGYGDTKFSFSGSGRHADARQDGAEPNAEGRSHAPEPTHVADTKGPERPDAIAADRLDIRL